MTTASPAEIRIAVPLSPQHRELIDGRELFDALRPPCPHLRRDVIQHGNAGGRGGRRGPEMIARIIDEDDEIVPLCGKRPLDAVQQPVMRRNLRECFDESDDRI